MLAMEPSTSTATRSSRGWCRSTGQWFLRAHGCGGCCSRVPLAPWWLFFICGITRCHLVYTPSANQNFLPADWKSYKWLGPWGLNFVMVSWRCARSSEARPSHVGAVGEATATSSCQHSIKPSLREIRCV